MKTTFKAKIIIETKKYLSCYSDSDVLVNRKILTLENIRKEIEKGHYKLEWISGDLGHDNEPTLIIKI